MIRIISRIEQEIQSQKDFECLRNISFYSKITDTVFFISIRKKLWSLLVVYRNF